jgi:hypothetical protein
MPCVINKWEGKSAKYSSAMWSKYATGNIHGKMREKADSPV